jgi:VanZ family protein
MEDSPPAPGRAIFPSVGDADRGKRIRAWLAVALWIGLILVFSGGQFSATHTAGWARQLVRAVFPGVDDATLTALNHVVRHLAHLSEYAVLGLLAFHALRVGSARGWLRAAALALALSLAVAVVDETHQRLLATRTGSPRDVALDLAGASGALLLLGLTRWVRRRPEVEGAA